MDPCYGAQDVPRCDLCETDIVHNYCDFCHVNLCIPCIGEHISDGYDRHKIVPFQERRSTIIYPKCERHSHKSCEFQCKECNTFVCSSCMASDQHKGHTFVNVIEDYKTKKGIIVKESEEFENVITPYYEEIVLELENELANLNGVYEKLTTTMSKQGEQWHKEIDIVINRMKTEISEIKVNHRDILRRHLDEIKQTQSLMKQTLLAIKELKISTEVSPTIEYKSKIGEFSKLLPKINVTLPTFIPKPIDSKKLFSLFGQITPLSTAKMIQNVLLPGQSNTSVRELMDDPELVATIQTGHENLRNVIYKNDDKIWTSGWTDEIKCFNAYGSHYQTIITKSGEGPFDIAVDVERDLLYSDGIVGTVNKVKNGQIEELIRLQEWKPGQLCVTSTGDHLLVMSDRRTQCKVVRYSGSTEKQTIQYDEEGKPLYSGNGYVKYITENRNHDICVAYWAAGAIVVVNQDGKLRWRYTGHPSVTKKKTFKPRGITTDSQSRILTADCNNHCIHILDQNGQFLRYIDNCDLKNPFGLCVDNKDNLFVCEYDTGHRFAAEAAVHPGLKK
eukprot:XP_019922576.1 PREDICTED: E3 ubiquitin-protein ligase arc-1 [Crassostrea gigas]